MASIASDISSPPLAPRYSRESTLLDMNRPARAATILLSAWAMY